MSYIRIYLNNVLIKQVELNQDITTIGRDADSDIVLDNAGVSTHHAVIEKEAGSYVIKDNESRNGVFVNGDKIDSHILKYRDEIQIYNYVLKYMAVAGLHDTEDPDIAQDSDPMQSGTMEVNIADVQDLLKLREQKKTAYLELLDDEGGKSRVLFKDQHFKIGKAKECDIRTSGWLPFGASAEIQRKSDGYYLTPQGWGRVTKNGEPLKNPTKIMDGDALRVGDLSMVFFHRVMADQ